MKKIEFLGGLGHLAIMYSILRCLEDQAAIFFIVAFLVMAYWNGYLIGYTEKQIIRKYTNEKN
jgi:hypothetical protein